MGSEMCIRDRFNIDNYSIKKFGSQGQQKSFIIALKLAQFEYLKEKTGSSPILLMDDIFDKLDFDRVKNIVEIVNLTSFGQLFIWFSGYFYRGHDSHDLIFRGGVLLA